MKKVYRFILAVSAAMLAFAANSLADDGIMFISQPVLTAQVGQVYEYDAHAVSQNGDSVMYELHSGPSGMTVDSQTGVVLWTPLQMGSFRVRIRAHRIHNSPNDGGSSEQEYTLRVLNGQPSVLRGVVQNAAGQGISNVRLRLFEEGSEHFLFSTASDSGGAYQFPAINAGTFLLRAEPRNNNTYASQWYDRVQRVQDATPISIPESSTVTINVTLLSHSTPAFVSVAGNVSDTSNVPIRLARVSIFRARHTDDLDDSGFNFEGLDHDQRDQKREATVLTDSNGNFSARLRPHRYIFMAEKQGFEQQFWDHKSTVLEADRLNLRADTSGINFNLKLQLPATGMISGRITAAGDTNAVRAHVIGFHRSTPSGTFSGFVREAQTDSLGSYMLPQLRNGYYVVLAIPHEEFIPTFYDTTGGTIRLSQAFPVAVNNVPVTNINIHVFPDTVTGMNRVRGTVSSGTVGLAGTIVYAVSSLDNAVVGAAVSENNGTFTLVGIAPGSYSLNTAKPGYTQTFTPSVSIIQNGVFPATVVGNLSLVFAPTSVASGTQPVEFVLKQNYPNPFNPSTKISFNVAGSGITTLKIFNIVGQEVATLVNEELKAGSYEKVFSGEGLSSGIYFYKLKNGNFAETRKMLLLK